MDINKLDREELTRIVGGCNTLAHLAASCSSNYRWSGMFGWLTEGTYLDLYRFRDHDRQWLAFSGLCIELWCQQKSGEIPQ